MIQAINNNSPVLILGMHRSGTSCLAGCLEQAGLFLGNVNRQAEFNKKGNHENLAIMEFNDQILFRVGAAWDRPPNAVVELTAPEKHRIQQLRASYPVNTAWGVKDPRILLLFEAWEQEIHPRLVGTFRHPAEVMNSLLRRASAWGQRMNETEAFNLWRVYNERLLRIHHTRPFPLVRFDQEPTAYRAAVANTARALGLPGLTKESFFDSILRSNYKTDTPIPDTVKPVCNE